MSPSPAAQTFRQHFVFEIQLYHNSTIRHDTGFFGNKMNGLYNLTVDLGTLKYFSAARQGHTDTGGCSVSKRVLEPELRGGKWTRRKKDGRIDQQKPRSHWPLNSNSARKQQLPLSSPPLRQQRRRQHLIKRQSSRLPHSRANLPLEFLQVPPLASHFQGHENTRDILHQRSGVATCMTDKRHATSAKAFSEVGLPVSLRSTPSRFGTIRAPA